MLKVSRRLNYGLQLMIALGNETKKSSKQKTIPTSVLAEQMGIPLPFLHQIAHALFLSGLISTTPGPNGGIRINYPPEKIKLLDIYEALEGKIGIANEGFDDNENVVKNSELIKSEQTWTDVEEILQNYLNSKTLEDIIKEE